MTLLGCVLSILLAGPIPLPGPPPVPPDITPPPAMFGGNPIMSRDEVRWPTSRRVVLLEASLPAVPWDTGHRGIDIAAAKDEEIRAVASGVVFFAGTVDGTPSVSIAHLGGRRTTYTPVEPLVEKGERVRAGQVIGILQSGHCPGPCLHLGLRDGWRYYDPMSLFEPTRVRLWPSGPGMSLPEGPAQSIR